MGCSHSSEVGPMLPLRASSDLRPSARWQSDVVPKGDKVPANCICLELIYQLSLIRTLYDSQEFIFAGTPDGEHFLTGES